MISRHKILIISIATLVLIVAVLAIWTVAGSSDSKTISMPTTHDEVLVNIVKRDIADKAELYQFNSIIRIIDANNSYYFVVASINDQLGNTSTALFVVQQRGIGQYNLIQGMGDGFTNEELGTLAVPKDSIDKIIEARNSSSPQQEDSQ